MPADIRPPNVLVILPHDLGTCLNCYGQEVVTSPNLDRLAGQGARLVNFFATAPECTPSRAGLFTGQYTHQNGLMGLCHRGWSFKRNVRHLAQALQNRGYGTYLFGMQHETQDDPTWLGYQHIDRDPCQLSGPVSERVCRFLQQPNLGQPWLVHAGFIDVHRSMGWPAGSDFDPAAIVLPGYLPDTKEVRAEFCRYYQAIKNMDAAVGRMVDQLDTAGQAENTLVVFVSDHGSPFPGAKSTLYDAGLRVACVVRWPGHIAPRQAPANLLSNIDLYPTILEACDAPIPPNIAGRSFLPLLCGRPYAQRDCVFGTFYYDAAYDPMYCVRTERFKYIRSFAPTFAQVPNLPPQMAAPRHTGRWIRGGDTDVQRSAAWEAMHGVDGCVPPEELYDLEQDPQEQRNLVGMSNYEAVLVEMRGRLREMMRTTESPLSTGHIPPSLSSSGNRPIRLSGNRE